MRRCLGRYPVLVALLAALFCALPARAQETIKVGGTGSSMRSMELVVDAFAKTKPGGQVTIVQGLGSRGGKRALLSGAIDLAISADPLTSAEREQGAVQQEFARTPFVFATSTTNPTSGLTLRELVDIYAGRVTTWPDGRRLRVILRPEGDSDTTHLKTISPAMAEAVKGAHTRPGLKVAATDQESADAIQDVPGALGTTTLALIVAEERPLKVLAVDGVGPSVASLQDRSYPYYKSFFLVTYRTPSPLLQRFVTFIRSPAGRQILVRLGHSVP